MFMISPKQYKNNKMKHSFQVFECFTEYHLGWKVAEESIMGLFLFPFPSAFLQTGQGDALM